MAEPKTPTWRSTNNQESPYHNTYTPYLPRANGPVDGLPLLRKMFPDPDSIKPTWIVLFSTGCPPGGSETIEQAEQIRLELGVGGVGFLIIDPRNGSTRFGVAALRSAEDTDYCLRLRASGAKVLRRLAGAAAPELRAFTLIDMGNEPQRLYTVLATDLDHAFEQILNEVGDDDAPLNMTEWRKGFKVVSDSPVSLAGVIVDSALMPRDDDA